MADTVVTNTQAGLTGKQLAAIPSAAVVASPPSSPVAGDMWMPADGFSIYRYSGSAWVPYGPVFPMTPPDNASFSWVNQGSATVDTTYGGIYLEGPPNGSNSVRMRVKSAPGTPYTLTVAIQGGPLTVNYQDVGLIFRESGTSKAIYFRLDSTGFLVSTVDASAGIVGNTYGPVGVFGVQPLFWRIADNGTNLLYSLSWDGQHFIQLYSASRTAYLAGGPNQIGFGVNDTTNVYSVGMTVLSWKVA